MSKKSRTLNVHLPRWTVVDRPDTGQGLRCGYVRVAASRAPHRLATVKGETVGYVHSLPPLGVPRAHRENGWAWVGFSWPISEPIERVQAFLRGVAREFA